LTAMTVPRRPNFSSL